MNGEYVSTLQYVVCGLVVLGVLLWLADSKLLAVENAAGPVTWKRIVEAHMEHRMVNVGGSNRPVPHAVPRQFLLKVKLAGGEYEKAVPREIYDRVQINEMVRVRYQRRRLTGAMQLLSVEP